MKYVSIFHGLIGLRRIGRKALIPKLDNLGSKPVLYVLDKFCLLHTLVPSPGSWKVAVLPL